MKRLQSMCILVLLASVVLVAAEDDAAKLIAAARQALGGEAALNAIATLAFSGTVTRTLAAHSTSESLEVSVVLPDKFMHVQRNVMDRGPLGSFDVTRYQGFNADMPINATLAPRAPFPVVIPGGPPPATPEEIAQAHGRQLNAARHTFLQVIVPLFATSSSAYSLVLTPAGQTTLPSGSADVIEMKGADGFTWRLMLDAVTHRPVKLAWKAKPIVTFSTASTVTTARGRTASSQPERVELPSIDPSSLDDVDWEMTIGDYKLADGLNWPRRMTTSFDGQKYEDLRIGKFKINPKIDPKTFAPPK